MKIRYNKIQLEGCIDYIVKNNAYNFSRQEVIDSIRRIVLKNLKNKELNTVSTMGFTVLFSNEEEDFVDLTFLVNPGLSKGYNFVTETECEGFFF